MAKIEAWLSCDLKKPVQVQGLSGNVFSMDNNGSRINVRIYDNGEKTTVSGSVTANCILADGSTINVNGSLTTDNGQSVAYVDIPQSCLLIPGPIRIAIKLTASGVITTLAAVVTTVYRTQTDIVVTPSQQIITDWNAEISAAIATQNAAIANQDTKINDLKSALNDSLCVRTKDYYSAVSQVSGLNVTPQQKNIILGKPIGVGTIKKIKVVAYGSGTLYIRLYRRDSSVQFTQIYNTYETCAEGENTFNVNIPVEEESYLGFYTGATGARVYYSDNSGGDCIVYKETSRNDAVIQTELHMTKCYFGASYEVEGYIADVESAIAEPFNEALAYSKGEYVTKAKSQNKIALYKFNADHSAGAWTGADADEVKICDDLQFLDSQAQITNPVLSIDNYRSLTDVSNANATTAQKAFIINKPIKYGTITRLKIVSDGHGYVYVRLYRRDSLNQFTQIYNEYHMCESGENTFAVNIPITEPCYIGVYSGTSNAGHVLFSDTSDGSCTILKETSRVDTVLQAETIISDCYFGLSYELINTLPTKANAELGFYKNQKILYLGDSITKLAQWIPFFEQIVEPAKSINVAVSGARWKDVNGTVYDGDPKSSDITNNCIGNQVEKIVRGKDSTNPNYSYVADYDDFDIIFISAGTNDYPAEPISEIENQFIVDGQIVPLADVNRKTFAGAMRYAYTKLRGLYPNAQLFICTPIQENYAGEPYDSLNDKRKLIKAVCDRLSVDCIDTFLCGICNLNNFPQGEGDSEDLEDGIHPNANGGKKIGRYNAERMIEKRWLIN